MLGVLQQLKGVAPLGEEAVGDDDGLVEGKVGLHRGLFWDGKDSVFCVSLPLQLKDNTRPYE